ncbi:hypothetical protein [Salinicola sp. NYA28a]
MALNAYQIGDAAIVVHHSPQEALMLYRRESRDYQLGLDEVVPVDDGLVNCQAFTGDGFALGLVQSIIDQQQEPAWVVTIDQ